MKGLDIEDLLKAILSKDSAELEEEGNSEEEEPKVAAVEVVSVGEPSEEEPTEELEDDFPLPSGMKEDLMMEEESEVEEESDEYEDEDPNSVECLLRKLLKK